MYKLKYAPTTGFNVNQSTEGQRLEDKIEQITNNREPIKDGAPLIFTERNEGVKAGYNIKTDRFEIAIDAIDNMQKSETARRESKATMSIVREDGGAESTQGTGTDK